MAYSSCRDPSLIAQLCDFILIEEDLFPPRAQNIEVGKQSAGRVKARLEGKVHFFSNFLFVQLLIIHLSRLREHKTAKVMFCQNLTPPVVEVLSGVKQQPVTHACMHCLRPCLQPRNLNFGLPKRLSHAIGGKAVRSVMSLSK